MTPESGLALADHAAAQASAPGGVLWVLIIVIICLFATIVVLGRWMFNQAVGFTEFLKSTNGMMVETVAKCTAALEACAEESRCTRELIRKFEAELDRLRRGP